MIREMQADFARYRNHGSSWVRAPRNPAVWAVIWYRFGHWVYKEGSPRLMAA